MELDLNHSCLRPLSTPELTSTPEPTPVADSRDRLPRHSFVSIHSAFLATIERRWPLKSSVWVNLGWELFGVASRLIGTIREGRMIVFSGTIRQ